MSTPDSRRRTLFALGMIFAPILMLIGDLHRILGGDAEIFRFSVYLQLALALFLLAVLGLVAELRPVADRAGLTGGVIAGFGLFVGTAMQGYFRTAYAAVAAVDQAGAQAVEEALTTPLFTAVTFYPGLSFPIGMLVLSLALLATRRVPALLGVLVAAGAVLFPVGRIGNLEWAVLASGVCFLAGLGWLAVRTLRGPAAAGEVVATRPLAA
jgi:hypothetical protein